MSRRRLSRTSSTGTGRAGYRGQGYLGSLQYPRKKASKRTWRLFREKFHRDLQFIEYWKDSAREREKREYLEKCENRFNKHKPHNATELLMQFYRNNPPKSKALRRKVRRIIRRNKGESITKYTMNELQELASHVKRDHKS